MIRLRSRAVTRSVLRAPEGVRLAGALSFDEETIAHLDITKSLVNKANGHDGTIDVLALRRRDEVLKRRC